MSCVTAAATLTDCLRLAQPPVAVCFIDSLPAGVRRLAFSDRVAALSRANAMPTTFHQIRRREVEAGGNPTVKETLAALQAHS